MSTTTPTTKKKQPKKAKAKAAAAPAAARSAKRPGWSGRGCLAPALYELVKTVEVGGTKRYQEVSTQAIDVLDDLATQVLVMLVDEAVRGNDHKVTVQSRDVQAATVSVLSEDMAKHAVPRLTLADATYAKSFVQAAKKAPGSGAAPARKVQRGQERAGLKIRPAMIRGYVKLTHPSKHVSEKTAVSLAAVVEYVADELITMAAELDEFKDMQRLTPAHLLAAVNGDADLKQLFESYVQLGGSSKGTKASPFVQLPPAPARPPPKAKKPKAAADAAAADGQEEADA
jgi:histone H3/H4